MSIWGRRLAAIGAAGLGFGLAFKIAAMNIPMGLMVLGLLLSRAPVHRMPGFWPVLGLVAWGVVSIVLVGGFGAIDGLGYLYVPLALPLLCCALAGTAWALPAAAIAAVAGLVFHAGLGAVQFVVGYETSAPMQIDPEGARFTTAPGMHEGNVGPAMYAGAILIALCDRGIGASMPGWIRWVGRLAGALPVLMNQSRGVILALGAATVGAHLRGWRRILVAGLAATVLVAIGMGLLYVRDPVRIQSMLAGDNHRVGMWQFGLQGLAEDPVLGTGGQKAFREGLEERWQQRMGGRWMDPNMKYNLHNTPLNYAVFNGVPAGVLHLLFLIALGVVCWRVSRAGGLAFGAWCFAVVCGMLDATFSSQKAAYAFSMMLALCITADQARSLGDDESAGQEAG